MKLGDFVSLILTVIPFLLGALIYDWYQSRRGNGIVDNVKLKAKR